MFACVRVNRLTLFGVQRTMCVSFSILILSSFSFTRRKFSQSNGISSIRIETDQLVWAETKWLFVRIFRYVLCVQRQMNQEWNYKSKMARMKNAKWNSSFPLGFLSFFLRDVTINGVCSHDPSKDFDNLNLHRFQNVRNHANNDQVSMDVISALLMGTWNVHNILLSSIWSDLVALSIPNRFGTLKL